MTTGTIGAWLAFPFVLLAARSFASTVASLASWLPGGSSLVLSRTDRRAFRYGGRGKRPTRDPALTGPLGAGETCGTARGSGASSAPRGPTIAPREHTRLSPRPPRGSAPLVMIGRRAERPANLSTRLSLNPPGPAGPREDRPPRSNARAEAPLPNPSPALSVSATRARSAFQPPQPGSSRSQQRHLNSPLCAPQEPKS